MARKPQRLTFESYRAILERELFARLVVTRHAQGDEWLVRGKVETVLGGHIINASISYKPYDPDWKGSQLRIQIRASQIVPDLPSLEWEMLNLVVDEMYNFDLEPWLLTHCLVDTPIVSLEEVKPDGIPLHFTADLSKESCGKVRSIPETDYRLFQVWAALRMLAAREVGRFAREELGESKEALETFNALELFYKRVDAYFRDLNRKYKAALEALVTVPIDQD
jgi:hypothetical protein